MALIKCPECGKEVSDKASCCVHCGCPIHSEQNTITTTNESKTYNYGFYYFSSSNGKVSVECKKCHKVWSFDDSNFYSIVDNTCAIPQRTLICPNCKNTVAPGTRINAKGPGDYTNSTSAGNATSQSNTPKKGVGCGTIFLIFFALLFLIMMMFGGGESTYEKTAHSAMDKWAQGDFSSMTKDERQYLNDFFSWWADQ